MYKYHHESTLVVQLSLKDARCTINESVELSEGSLHVQKTWDDIHNEGGKRPANGSVLDPIDVIWYTACWISICFLTERYLTQHAEVIP